MSKQLSPNNYEYTYIVPAENDTEFLHDVSRHEASAMFGERGSRWMIWLAKEAIILGFERQADWAKFAMRWQLVFRQLLDEGSLT